MNPREWFEQLSSEIQTAIQKKAERMLRQFPCRACDKPVWAMGKKTKNPRVFCSEKCRKEFNAKRQQKYTEENLEIVQKYRRHYYLANKEKIKEKIRKLQYEKYWADPEAAREKQRKHYWSKKKKNEALAASE